MDICALIRDPIPLIDALWLLNLSDPISAGLFEMLRSKKRSLKRVRVLYTQLFEKHDSCCSILVLFSSHFAFVRTKDWAPAMHVLRYAPNDLVRDSRCLLIAKVFAGIHEDVHVSTVTVHIAGKDNATSI